MTLEELHFQLSEVLRLHPQHANDEANFISGSEISWPGEDDIPGEADPEIHSIGGNSEIIDGLTRVFDSDVDDHAWVFHS